MMECKCVDCRNKSSWVINDANVNMNSKTEQTPVRESSNNDYQGMLLDTSQSHCVNQNRGVVLYNQNCSLYDGQRKNGRGKIMDLHNDQFIEGEWQNDRLIKIRSAQFLINTDYFRLNGIDNLYSSNKNNFVARIVLPPLDIRSENFNNIRQEIESKIIVTKILEDDLKNNLETSREKFESMLKVRLREISSKTQRDMFHLFLMMKHVPKCHDNYDENIIILNNISNNEHLSDPLRNQAINLCQDEKIFAERNKTLFTMNQVTKFSWKQLISEYINSSIVDLKAAFIKALPSRTMIPTGHADINKLLDRQLFTCNVDDIQLFSDLELTTRQYSKTFESVISNVQDFIQNYVRKLWALLITKIMKSEDNDTSYTNAVFLQLFKTFFELLNSVCVERNEEITELIDIKSDADLCIVKSQEDAHINRLKFLISLMNHFKPGDVKNQKFKYNFSFFKINETIFNRLTGFIVHYFDNSLNIPQESVIWLYYIHTSFSDIFSQNEAHQSGANKHELFAFLNSLMNLFKIVVTNQDVIMEKVRILANSVIKFGTTISPYFLEKASVNDDEMKILLKQAEYMKDFVTSNDQTVNDITNIVDIYQVFWDERKKLLTDLKNEYSDWSCAVEELHEKFNAFTQFVLNLNIYNNKFLMFLRSYNEFMRLLRGTNFPWYIKKEYVYSENFVELVNKDTNSYRVKDIKKFVSECLDNSKELPRHFLFNLSKNLLSCVEDFIDRNAWTSSEKMQAGSELLLLISRSFIDFNKLSSAVDFQHFYALFTEPFHRLTQHSSNLHDFTRRLSSLENYYKYTMELNVMSVAKALELCEQNITSNNSLLHYTFNTEQLTLSYTMYEKKFKNYIEKHILQPDFDVDKFAEKVRTKAKSIDISKWDSGYKILELPTLVAGLSAVWSALESKDVIYLKQVMKPHCIQILCVLRLLGADQAQSGFENHLAQVLTGQGKSLVLALLAAALALTGNRVRIVCYNEHLASRDQQNFQVFYKTLNIANKINYGIFENMANEVLSPKIKGKEYNLRLFVSELITGELPRLCVTAEEDTEVSKTVLLIDEVDVFFSPEFYGNTLNPATAIDSETLADLQLKIWNLTVSTSKSDIKEIVQKYIDETFSQSTDETFVNIVRNNRNILNIHVDKMISDAVKIRNGSSGSQYSQSYKLGDDGRIILIKADGEYRTSTFCDYNNVFMYFKLKKQNFEHKNFHNYGYIIFGCGNVSYANLPKDYRAILGVTGTLKQLSAVEMRAIASYNITRGSDMPSFFGTRKLCITGFTILNTNAEWSKAILDSILSVVEDGRAVIVFFINEHWFEFFRGTFSKHLSNYSVLTGNEDKEEIERCVEEAGVARKVTIAIHRMGRGVDFKSNDSAVEMKGGVHVIQTTWSEDVKEETQIKGRTARKDNSGSYELILCREHLVQMGYENPDCTYDELNVVRATRAEEKGTELEKKIEMSQQQHDATMKFLRSFYNYNPDKRHEYFKKYPFVDL